MTDIEITTDVSPVEWDAFLLTQQNANCYHGWEWRRIFENAFGHETTYLAAKSDHQIVGVLPLVLFRSRMFGRFAVSLPFVDGGGVCATNPEVGALLVERAETIAAEQHLSHIELRHVSRQFPSFPARENKVGMRRRLESTSASAWNALDRKVRNQVRKAEKSGLTTRTGGIELLSQFYAVFARNMRDLGTPVYPRRLFQDVLSTFSSSTRVFLVEQGQTVVSAGISLLDRDRLTVPWASSLREYPKPMPQQSSLLAHHRTRHRNRGPDP